MYLWLCRHQTVRSLVQTRNKFECDWLVLLVQSADTKCQLIILMCVMAVKGFMELSILSFLKKLFKFSALVTLGIVPVYNEAKRSVHKNKDIQKNTYGIMFKSALNHRGCCINKEVCQ